MLIYYTYELSNQSWQTAATDSIADALFVCEDKEYKLMIDLSDLPQAIKELREYNKLSQEKMGQLMGGYSKQTVAALEKGRRTIGFAVLRKIEAALKIKFGITISLLVETTI